MTLRARLVLVLGSLVALLLGAEWWLVRTLTRELDQEVDVVALTVGSSLLSLFVSPEGETLVAPDMAFGHTFPSDTGAALFAPLESLSAGEVEAMLERFPGPLGPARRAGFDVRDEFRFSGDLEVIVLQGEHDTTSHELPARLGTGADRRGSGARVALRIGSHETALPFLPQPAEASLEPGLGPLSVVGRTQTNEALDGVDVQSHFARKIATRVEVHAEAEAAPAPPETDTAAPASVRIPVPRGGLDRAVDTFLSKLLLGSIALFVLGLGAIAWVAHRVTRPLRGLAVAAQRVGAGELGVRVAEDGDAEVAATLRAFNGMSQRLAALDEEAQQLRDRQHLGELGDVARGLAHALRNPLHTLGLAVDALARDDEQARATARAARTQIERIDGALEGFLTLAGAGGTREQVALDDLARDVALELAQSTVPVAVRVVAPGGPVPVACIPAELRAVVHALVVNAAEAAPGEPVVVEVEALAGGNRARLRVLDRGPGLAPEVRAKLFTPHVTTKAHGTGMGLYLAERIARTRYAGGLALLDRPGGGVEAVLEVGVEPLRRESDSGAAAGTEARA